MFGDSLALAQSRAGRGEYFLSFVMHCVKISLEALSMTEFYTIKTTFL